MSSHLEKQSPAPAPPITLDAVVLAAGQGTRMRSATAKVLHVLCGKPMLTWTLQLLPPLAIQRTVVVLGHQADAVLALLGQKPWAGVLTALQAEQRGTADAVRTALPVLPTGPDAASHVLILYGDTPLLTQESLQKLVRGAVGNALSLLVTTVADPTGYGRIVRGRDQAPVRIVEDRDCTAQERALGEINAGMYVVAREFLQRALSQVTTQNAQKELYLTDLVRLAAEAGLGVEAISVPSDEVLGVNDRCDLSVAEDILRQRINRSHQRAGVTLRDPRRTYVDAGVTIGADSELHPGVMLQGNTRIGAGCVLETGVVLRDCTVGDGVMLKAYTVATEATFLAGAAAGPFAHLRPGSVLDEHAKVGNFVELKKTRLGRGSKASHLSYLGDAVIGANVNVGCGTITCNYDGVHKYQTVLEDEVFVGSDSQLVAPVRIGRGAVIAAGSTVTQDVPADALVLSRTPQTNRPGGALRYREKRAAKQAAEKDNARGL